MALEGTDIKFTITNNTGESDQFYWWIKEPGGDIYDFDFTDPSNGLFSPSGYVNGFNSSSSNTSPSVSLAEGESTEITLSLNDDKLIEADETFEIASKTDAYNATETLIATFTIEDAEESLITTSASELFSATDWYSIPHQTAPGGGTTLDKDEDFPFATYMPEADDGETWTATKINKIFYISKDNALIQHKKSQYSDELNGEFFYTSRDAADNFKTKIEYEQLPELADFYSSQGITSATFDEEGNLYCIHSDRVEVINSNGIASNKPISRLSKHDAKGNLVWVKSNTGGTDLTYDHDDGLILSRANDQDTDTIYLRVKTSDGSVDWESQPYSDFTDNAGFGTTERSIQILNDGSFLAATSGHLLHSSGSFIAKLSLEDGSLQSLTEVDNDASYSSYELFNNKGNAYLRTAVGAHKVDIPSAGPLEQKYPHFQLEGSEITFTITNNSDEGKRFYWSLEATDGTIYNYDFVSPPDDLFYSTDMGGGIKGLSTQYGQSPSAYLNSEESETITLKINDDNVIESAKTFKVISITDDQGASQETLATFTIEDAAEPSITTTETDTFEIYSSDNNEPLKTSPGGAASINEETDFPFADYSYVNDEGWSGTSNRVENAFYVSEESALLQYKSTNYDDKHNGEIAYATRDENGGFQQSITYEALPTLSGYSSRGITAFSFDENDYLYSIHYDTNYDATNPADQQVRRLAAHDNTGNLLWTNTLNYGNSLDLEYDNNGGLIIARTSNYNGNVYYDHHDASTGANNWTSDPYTEFQYGGFGTSKRSIQILDDNTFLASSSGWLTTGSNMSGTYLAKISLVDGSLQSLLSEVDSDASYDYHELFEDSGLIYLRSRQGVHEVTVDANPISQNHPTIEQASSTPATPTPTTAPAPSPTSPTPSPSPAPSPSPSPTPTPTPSPAPTPTPSPAPNPAVATTATPSPTSTTTPAPTTPLSPTSLPDNLADLGASDISSLTPAAIGTLTSDDVQALSADAMQGFSSSQVAALNNDAVAELSIPQLQQLLAEAVQGLSPAQISELPPKTIKGFSSAQIEQLTKRTFKALDTDQLAKLRKDAITGLTSAQLKTLSGDELAAFKPGQLKAIDPESMSGLKPKSLNALSKRQARAFSDEQLAGLSMKQIKKADAFIDHLTPKKSAGLSFDPRRSERLIDRMDVKGLEFSHSTDPLA